MAKKVSKVSLALSPVPQSYGKQCPVCGAHYEQYEHPTIMQDPYGGGCVYDTVPHADPFDCIRELRRLLIETMDMLEEVKRDVRKLDRGR